MVYKTEEEKYIVMSPYPRDAPAFIQPISPAEEFNNIPNDKPPQKVEKSKKPKYEIVWRNVMIFAILHSIALYGLYLSPSAKLATIILSIFMYHLVCFGVTAGAHRLWSHRSYKAKLPLRAFLVVAQTMAHQNSVIEWARDHRSHHKFEETNADPHNALNGFFFSHMGWLLCKKHEDVKIKGKGLDLSDLYADPLLRYQDKYFIPLMLLMCFVLPTVVPMFLWNETFMNAYTLNVLRYVCSLHATWLVNSWAHMWGNKPYDKNIKATQSYFVSLFAIGEGWHNYHHAFPWDYKAAEFGKLNLTLNLLNLFAKIGWAHDLKTVSTEMIKHKVNRSGDGSHEIWGWGDKDQSPEDMKHAVILNKQDE